MNFSRSITAIINERISRRTYLTQPIEKDLKKKIVDLLKNNEFKSPFSTHAGKIRFELIEVSNFDPSEKKRLGTYGFIKGAQFFIVGAVEKTNYCGEHYGYNLETIILAATDLGLGTCWLGGFFNRSLFSAKIKCGSEEEVPAITPIGYYGEALSREKFIRRIAKADRRLQWDQIFFDDDFNTPLSRDDAGEFITMLENVRLSPSAGNKQPWRIVKEHDRKVFHFYVLRSEKFIGVRYNRFRPLDIGIAVSHFDLTAKELGIGGTWFFEQPKLSGSEELSYVLSWRKKIQL